MFHLMNDSVFSEHVNPTSNVLAYDTINQHFNETFGAATTPSLLRALSDRANGLANEFDDQPYGSTNGDIAFIQNAASLMQNLVAYLDFTPNETQSQGMMMRRMVDGLDGGDGRSRAMRVNPIETPPTMLSFLDERARSTLSSAINSWWNN